MIISKLNRIGSKSLTDIKSGDILRRMQDGFYYQLESIHTGVDDVFYYNFKSFTIKGKFNLKQHFKTENGSFEIYSKEI
jgi:hypothetical protein